MGIGEYIPMSGWGSEDISTEHGTAKRGAAGSTAEVGIFFILLWGCMCEGSCSWRE